MQGFHMQICSLIIPWQMEYVEFMLRFIVFTFLSFCLIVLQSHMVKVFTINLC